VADQVHRPDVEHVEESAEVCGLHQRRVLICGHVAVGVVVAAAVGDVVMLLGQSRRLTRPLPVRQYVRSARIALSVCISSSRLGGGHRSGVLPREVRDGVGDPVGVGQRRHVSAVLQQQQPCVGDAGSEALCLLGGVDGVELAVDDQTRRGALPGVSPYGR
jgi:hypothetical protein